MKYDGNEPDRFWAPWIWARERKYEIELEGVPLTCWGPAYVAVYEDRDPKLIEGYGFDYVRRTFVPCVQDEEGVYAPAESVGILLRVVDRDDEDL